MSKKQTGDFTANLCSLQLQVATLFEGCGGEKTIKLLDGLSRLGSLEKDVVLDKFSAIIDQFVTGEDRFFTAEDIEKQEFEDNLYKEILSAMKTAARAGEEGDKRLEVLDGGKAKSKRAPLDLAKARLAKKVSLKPIIN